MEGGWKPCISKMKKKNNLYSALWTCIFQIIWWVYVALDVVKFPQAIKEHLKIWRCMFPLDSKHRHIAATCCRLLLRKPPIKKDWQKKIIYSVCGQRTQVGSSNVISSCQVYRSNKDSFVDVILLVSSTKPSHNNRNTIIETNKWFTISFLTWNISWQFAQLLHRKKHVTEKDKVLILDCKYLYVCNMEKNFHCKGFMNVHKTK